LIQKLKPTSTQTNQRTGAGTHRPLFFGLGHQPASVSQTHRSQFDIQLIKAGSKTTHNPDFSI